MNSDFPTDSTSGDINLRELNERWDRAIKKAPPAVIRAYYDTIRRVSKDTLLYGMVGVCAREGLTPEQLVSLLYDEEPVRVIADARHIDLDEPITNEEHEEYKRFVFDTFRSEIEQRQAEKAIESAKIVWREGHLDA